MKLKISKKPLSSILTKMNKTIDAFPIINSLSYLKVTVKNEGVTILGSNNSVTIKYTLPTSEDVIVKEEGEVLVKYKELYSIVRSCDGDVISFSTNGKNSLVRITGTKAKFKLNSIDVNEYPNIMFLSGDKSFEIPGTILNDAINMTSYTVSTKETQPVLTGVHFVGTHDSLTLIATDRYRITRTIVNDSAVDSTFETTIAKEDLDSALQFLKDTEKVKITITERNVYFECENCVIQIKVLSGGYPNMDRILVDRQGILEAKVNTKDLMSVINRASILKDHEDIFVINANANNEIVLSTDNDEVGSYEENIEDILNIETIDVKPDETLTVALRLKHLSDALKNSSNEEVKIKVTGPRTPFYVFDENENVKRMSIIMPSAHR